jgi:pimeloyl-ACP methyl ester carboxylesterase
MILPFTDFGGEGPTLVFMHANGYPPACYQPLIERLKTRHRVLAMHQRPLWPFSRPEEIKAWHPLSDDLMLFLDEHKIEQASIVGHSMGAIVSLRAAIRKPERFKALVLIDPVLFRRRLIAAWNIAKLLGLASRFHPMVIGARKRRRHFDNLEKVFSSYRRKHVFHYMDDEALWIYITGITRPAAGGGFELIYSPEWEARIYETGVRADFDIWFGIPNLKIPTLVLRGAETDTFLAPAAARLQKANPSIRVETLEKATHLVPLEKPDEVSQSIEKFLQGSSPAA